MIARTERPGVAVKKYWEPLESDPNAAKLTAISINTALVEPVETCKKRDFAETGTSLRQAQGAVF